jgi:hypothetical protein
MLVAETGQHTDGGAGRRFEQHAQRVESLRVRQAEVEQHTVHTGQPPAGLGQRPGDDQIYRRLRLVEEFAHQEGVALVVLDQQDTQPPARAGGRVTRPGLTRHR